MGLEMTISLSMEEWLTLLSGWAARQTCLVNMVYEGGRSEVQVLMLWVQDEIEHCCVRLLAGLRR